MEYTPIKKKTSGFAIASVALIILCPPLAIIFGIMALKQIKNKENELSGNNLAYIGIIIGSIFIFIFIAFYPIFARAKEKANRNICLGNLRIISIAIMGYTQDYDGIYPPADRWTDVISQYSITNSRSIYICPSEENQQQQSYAFNISLNNVSGTEIKNPGEKVCFYDSIPGNNQAGGQELLPYPGRHFGIRDIHGKYYNGNSILFADGRVKIYKDSYKFNWDPKTTSK